MDPKDVKTYPLFGDGAGAVLLTADAEAGGTSSAETAQSDQPSGILSYKLASDGSQGDALIVPACGSRLPVSAQTIQQREQFLKMDGRTVFKWAVRMIPEIIKETLALAEMNLEDIDLFIPHQANTRIINAAVESVGLDPGKVFVNLNRYGNTSAASIPVAIVEALQQGRIKRGDNVLMVGFGGGLTWGSCLFRW
jgi:3-oxoacyl-[acyl-carrier-protein] synthase-3